MVSPAVLFLACCSIAVTSLALAITVMILVMKLTMKQPEKVQIFQRHRLALLLLPGVCCARELLVHGDLALSIERHGRLLLMRSERRRENDAAVHLSTATCPSKHFLHPRPGLVGAGLHRILSSISTRRRRRGESAMVRLKTYWFSINTQLLLRVIITASVPAATHTYTHTHTEPATHQPLHASTRYKHPIVLVMNTCDMQGSAGCSSSKMPKFQGATTFLTGKKNCKASH